MDIWVKISSIEADKRGLERGSTLINIRVNPRKGTTKSVNKCMLIKEKITTDLKKALKEKLSAEISTLRMLQAALLNKEKEKRAKLAKEKEEIKEEELAKESQLTDDEIIDVISSEIKKRKEAIEGFEKGERQDLVEKEKKEVEILEKYLPEQLSEEEIKKLAKEAISKVGDSGPQDMGKVMGELMPKVKGKAEGGLVSKLVKELLSEEK